MRCLYSEVALHQLHFIHSLAVKRYNHNPAKAFGSYKKWPNLIRKRDSYKILIRSYDFFHKGRVTNVERMALCRSAVAPQISANGTSSSDHNREVATLYSDHYNV